jgi:hypothetical protein
MVLPLLLAGPILRRVEPNLVSVWLAFSERCDVVLQTWEGRSESGRSNPFAESPVTQTRRVGAKLHLAVVTVQIPDTAGTSFQPDSIYSYDLRISPESLVPGNNAITLTSLGMLEARVINGIPQLPLGFEPGLLPSFAPPPSELTDLNLLYGSCRRPLHRDPDALAMVDDLIFGDDRYKDPRRRPHQLFLGGDQIYADDVSIIHMPMVIETGVELIGTTVVNGKKVAVEHLPLDEIAMRMVPDGAVEFDEPWESYRQEPSVDTEADPLLPAGFDYWPEGHRLDTTRIDAQLTSEDGESHLLSVGEFAALYLSVWSPALWGEEVVGASWFADTSSTTEVPLRWDQELPPFDPKETDPPHTEGQIVMRSRVFPERIPGHLYVAPPPGEARPLPASPEVEAERERARQRKKQEERRKEQAGLRRAFAVHREFRKNLPKVQRALANVATYMILDDHDVTDDYFLNPIWRRRVLGQRLGRAILGNGMIAYALFQDWGNDPLAYRSGPKAELLTNIRNLFPENAPKGPAVAAFTAIEQLLTHDKRELIQTPDRRFADTNPKLKWHFTVDGPKHRVIAFDNRTRRSYAGQNGPPGNVSIDAMVDQIPLPPLPADREILIVIAPLQVIGPPVLDEIVAPLSYRIFDAVGAKNKHGNTDASSPTGLRQMTGTNPDAIEAWAFDAVTFEHLLARLEPYGRAVILSGDVHYSSGTVMSYWKGNATTPTRFAQFTSSGFKNVMPPMITFVDPALGLAQQLIRLNLGTERIAWKEVADDLVLFPTGVDIEDLKPVMKSRLRTVPVMVPPWGWPDLNDPAHPENVDASKTTRLNPARPPDWRWRVRPLLDARDEHDDQRPDDTRPASVSLVNLEPEVETKLADPSTVFEGYQRVAARHQHALNRLRNARQILFRANVGRLRFEKPAAGALNAVHEVITTFKNPDDAAAVDPEPEIFLKQVAPLGPADEKPPDSLRSKAIQVIPPEVP